MVVTIARRLFIMEEYVYYIYNYLTELLLGIIGVLVVYTLIQYICND